MGGLYQAGTLNGAKEILMAINPSGLNKNQISELQKLLQTKQKSLIDEIAELERELQEEADSGKENTADEVDRSSFEEEMQRQQSVLFGKQQILDEVISALDRMTNGTFGICLESEEPIGFDRLKAQPWVKYTLDVQKEMEARKKRPHGSSGGDPGYPSAF